MFVCPASFWPPLYHWQSKGGVPETVTVRLLDCPPFIKPPTGWVVMTGGAGNNDKVALWMLSPKLPKPVTVTR